MKRSWIKRGAHALTRWTKLNPVNAEKKARRRKKYAAYLKSAAWLAIKKEIHARAGHRCEMRLLDGTRCPATDHLHVHHKTYARFGAELPTDLALLCKPHHEAFHAAQGKRGAA